ncbi:sugar transferase [Oceanobacillus oncorhynchi subsp. oncorhynchi]|uniref:sugar transferase n=1 Tax=Oceanobacillus oncorhynchi TaxID=545501 RepID=UPI0031DD96C2
MYDKTFKRTLDLILALALAIPLGVVGIIVAILIKLDNKGAIFFKQERVGKNGKVFKIYKFRTMIENAMNVGSGLSTFEGDPRVTKVGSLLRKTSLDEIPQLINVIKGEMSFVGPRPPVPYHPKKYEDYSNKDKKRFTVRPGITGYAQVKGRNSLTWAERFVFDNEYVDSQNLWLDIKIVFLTFHKIIKSENIHGPSRRKKK